MVQIANTRTAPHHSTSNGLTERLNRTIISMIQKAVSEEEDEWDGHLPKLLMYYRSAVHSSTVYGPYHLMFALFRVQLFHHGTKYNVKTHMMTKCMPLSRGHILPILAFAVK